ncbi:hypothetical protein MMC30_003841 [Trapelia coarctata]|nr:hypothetical protein [Trapelia coarctata]
MPPTPPTVLSSSSVSSPPLSSSSPSAVGPSSVSTPTQTSTYALRLSRPTALSSVGDSETQYGLTLPFSMSLYTTTDTQITITTNGLITIGSSTSIYEAYTDNTPLPPSSLPASVLNPGTAAVWWQYLQVADSPSPEGVWYQIENNNAVYIEWLIEDAKGLVYQFIANYSTGSPGRMGFYYFATGDGGVDATIGIQGEDADSITRAVEYMHGGNLSPGVLVEFDTNPQDTVVGIFSDTVFNLSCFPAGSFSAGIC